MRSKSKWPSDVFYPMVFYTDVSVRRAKSILKYNIFYSNQKI